MEPTNGRYEAGRMSADIENLQSDVTEIKDNVQTLVDKLWRLETRVYIVATVLALASVKGAALLDYLFTIK